MDITPIDGETTEVLPGAPSLEVIEETLRKANGIASDFCDEDYDWPDYTDHLVPGDIDDTAP